jgi:Right handed beta helix region
MSILARRHCTAVSVLSLAILACTLPASLSAATVQVGHCKSLATYPTIQTAVNSVPANSTIYVCPGLYPEQVLINKNLTITGVSASGLTGASAAGADNPVITSPANGLIVNATDLASSQPIAAQVAVISPTTTPVSVKLNYIAIDGSNNQLSGCATDLVGIYYQNASGTINDVATRFQELDPSDFGCQDGLAIYVVSGYGSGGSATVTISNSSVHDYDKNGITVDGSATVATITGNYVVGIGATPLIAQNGIQISDGATGSVKTNTITDDIYVNPQGGPYYGSSGILLYDAGGASSNAPLVISGNTVSSAQLPIVAYSDGAEPSDYVQVTLNKITNAPLSGTLEDDAIDLCSNNNTATSNVIFNASGSGIHIDSTCSEGGNPTGNNTTVTKNTINEACVGVLTGGGTGSSQSANIFYNTELTTQPGDSCTGTGEPAHAKTRLKPSPRRR